MSESGEASKPRGEGLFVAFLAGLLLVPLAGYGGAKAVVWLNSQTHVHYGYETSTCGSLRAYCFAQAMFRRNSPDYAHPFVRLCYLGPGQELIPCDLAAAAGPAGVPKRGYLFQDMSTIGGRPIDWTKEFALCATPSAYGSPARHGKTGFRTFIVSTDGLIYVKDRGCSGFVYDYPADLGAEGWEIAE